MRIVRGLKFRLEADVDDYKQMLRDGWAGSENGVVERVEGRMVAVRFQDGQGWRFTLAEFPTLAVAYDWPGEVSWGD